MLFNSYEFVLVFFPVTIVLFYLFSRIDARYGLGLLIVASMIFYAWWDARFLVLLIGSIVFNFLVASELHRLAEARQEREASRLLTVGIVVNLGALAFFKYGHFILDNWNLAFGTRFTLGAVILPLGISFFTFEQIAYLVDVRRRQAPAPEVLPYTLFVSFFPRLVAGPILRYTEIFPQLRRKESEPVDWENLAVGLTIFFIGLFKKAFLADGISTFANTVFGQAARGEQLDLFIAWGGALAYTLQLYFDFSAYSDMAIGIARCFGIRFPVNFFSPYKSTSIIEFWRRWHITLSRFLRDYLYIGLGGNRHGSVRRYANLLVTMLLGGLWHGANWTFVFWGGLHGLYLVINHAWRAGSRYVPGADRLRGTALSRLLAWTVTFMAVVIGWVFFRSTTFGAAMHMLQAMSGANGASIPISVAAHFGSEQHYLARLGITAGLGSGTLFTQMYAWIGGLFAIAILFPNTAELLAAHKPALNLEQFASAETATWKLGRIRWEPTVAWSVAIAFLGLVGIVSITRASEFLYWQF